MLRRVLTIAVILVFVSAPAFSAGPLEAVTKDGRTVILNPDGAWKYKDGRAGGVMGDASSMDTPGRLRIKGFFELRYDPGKWSYNQPGASKETRVSMVHKSGDVYATVIVEQFPLPFNLLKDSILRNARNVDPNAAIIEDRIKPVNGRDILYLKMKAKVNGVELVYHGHYWSGDAGAAQVFAFTLPHLEPDFRADMMAFLDGFAISEDGAFSGAMGSDQ